MAKMTVRAKEQKRFVKLFSEICQWNAPWERWNDMVTLFAIEIANPLDTVNREKRNELYASIARKYKQEELTKFAEVFAEMVEQLETNPFQDFLGSMYMELELGNDHAGQFFTPYNICKMMAKTQITEVAARRIADHGYITINDPACGGGATMIAAAGVLHELGIDWQNKAYFIGQDLDTTVAMMCYVQMSLIGCAGYVRIGDTLTNPQNCDVLLGEGTPNTWYFPMTYLSREWQDRIIGRQFLRVIGSLPNPKMIRKEEPKDVGSVPDSGSGVQISFFD